MASGLSGSTIKSWSQYCCERKTRYELMDPRELAAIPVAKDQREQPWASFGGDSEDRVVTRLAREAGVLRPARGEDGLLARHRQLKRGKYRRILTGADNGSVHGVAPLGERVSMISGQGDFVWRAGLISLQPSARHFACL